jgi:hypothetical protein
MDGACLEGDEECILIVMEFSSSKGDLRSVVSSASMADSLLWALSGYEDDRARVLFGRNGIKW